MLTGHKAAVLGSPVSHSLSPALHRAAYAALHLDSWSYAALDVTVERLPGALSRLGPEWAGLSLTMPLKEVALEVAEDVSDLARATGAANTLVRRPSSGWAAHNTDVHGVVQALREAGLEVVTSAVVIGSGATARSVVAALAVLGARTVTFVVRTRARPQTLDHAAACGLDVDVVGPDRAAAALTAAQVVVSTVPGGTAVPLVVPPPWRDSRGSSPRPVALDVVYARWPTPFARDLQAAGATVVSGFEMLLHQAAEQVRLMTGLEPPVDAMRAAGLVAMGAGAAPGAAISTGADASSAVAASTGADASRGTAASTGPVGPGGS